MFAEMRSKNRSRSQFHAPDAAGKEANFCLPALFTARACYVSYRELSLFIVFEDVVVALPAVK